MMCGGVVEKWRDWRLFLFLQKFLAPKQKKDFLLLHDGVRCEFVYGFNLK